MEDELIHELAAGYAMHALSPQDERAYEAHLARCPCCRETVAAFAETAGAMAFAAPPAQPPAELRERILAAARREREAVAPPRRRWTVPVLGAAAAAATCAAIGLGVWAATLDSGPAPLRGLALRGASGSVVVGAGGQAELVVAGLAPAPAGKTYELWVLRGRSALPAGLFSSRHAGATVVHLSRAVRSGSRVGVTIEPAGGSPQPTSAPIVLSAIA